jgi:hypothetical protein
VVLVFPDPLTARYIRVDLADGAAPYADVGRLVVGYPWQLRRCKAYIQDLYLMFPRKLEKSQRILPLLKPTSSITQPPIFK